MQSSPPWEGGSATLAGLRLVWAVTLLAVWLGFCYFVSQDLLILGRPARGKPRLGGGGEWCLLGHRMLRQ